jgi:hypothetical protein
MFDIDKVKIIRNVQATTYPFTRYFEGFENVEAVRKIFKNETEQVLQNLQVEFIGRRGYMGVSNLDGHLMISSEYLRKGDLIDIYLDIIHELVHVKQFIDGKELFDHNFSYVDRPTEIEAYRYTVEVALKMGLEEERICDYLKTEWMSEADFHVLIKNLDLNCCDS